MRLSIIKFHKFLLKILLLLTPLIYYPKAYNPYELPKFIFFIGIGLLILIVSFFIKPKYIKVNNHNLSIDKLSGLILLYWSINLFADLFGLDPKTSFLGSEFRHQGFLTLTLVIVLYFIIKSYVLKKEEYFKTIIYSNLLVSLYTIIQAIRLYFFKENIANYNGRIVGTIGNPNSLAGYLVITLSFFLTLFKKPFLNLRTVLISIFILLNFYLIYLTGSNSGWLTILLTVVVLFLIFLAAKFKKLLIGLLVILIFLPILFNQQLKKNFSEYLTSESCKKSSNPKIDRSKNLFSCLFFPDIENQRYSKDQTLNKILLFLNRGSLWENRSLFWTEGFKSFLKRPILGYGQENFELIIPRKLKIRVDNAHNIFLEILVASGIVGLVLFLLIIVEVFKKAPFLIKIFLVVYLIRTQFNPLSIAEIIVFWFTLGLI